MKLISKMTSNTKTPQTFTLDTKRYVKEIRLLKTKLYPHSSVITPMQIAVAGHWSENAVRQFERQEINRATIRILKRYLFALSSDLTDTAKEEFYNLVFSSI